MRRLSPALAGVALLAACSSVAPPPALPAPTTSPSPAVQAPADPAPAAPAATLQRARSRWVAVDWRDLPGWDSDRVAEAWPALLRSCDRTPPGWQLLCAEARLTTPGDDATMRHWLVQRLQPYRIEAPDGRADGMITGYFEPLVAARRQRSTAYRVPLHAPPPDLAMRRPWWTRQQIDTLPVAQAALRGREIAWVADPMDALLLQVQGSGRLRLTEADGSVRLLRVAYAGHNDQPYASVGRWLIDQGELKPDAANWPAIKDWAQRNPARVQTMLWANPRYVFFREEPLPDPSVGPRGAQGVALTPGRSVAVDAQSVPYGTPLWLDATEPLSSRPLQRLVLAQDTGSAITGAVRADYFWGWGTHAEAQAGRMKQPLRWWALWPKPAPPAR